jgi:hypothetical protein
MFLVNSDKLIHSNVTVLSPSLVRFVALINIGVLGSLYRHVAVMRSGSLFGHEINLVEWLTPNN